MSRPPPIPPDDVPEPDAEPTSAEKAQARAFGELLDKALAGRTPPAMAADDRELLEVATIIRAVSHPADLSQTKTSTLVEGALRQAVGGAGRPSVSDPGIVAIGAARAARGNRLPWTIAISSAAVAAAAVVMLVAGVGVRSSDRATAPAAAAATTKKIPDHWRSRPADDLIGAIPKEKSGDAATRIDAIFADRLDGYRERTLAGKTGKRGGR
jgi:hypothetical protein